MRTLEDFIRSLPRWQRIKSWFTYRKTRRDYLRGDPRD